MYVVFSDWLIPKKGMIVSTHITGCLILCHDIKSICFITMSNYNILHVHFSKTVLRESRSLSSFFPIYISGLRVGHNTFGLNNIRSVANV